MKDSQTNLTSEGMQPEAPKLQLHKSKALLAAHAASARIQLRRCVVREKRLFCQGIQEIAKRHDIGYNDVLDLLEEQAVDDALRAHARGFKEGQIAAKFAPLPLIRDRRVA